VKGRRPGQIEGKSDALAGLQRMEELSLSACSHGMPVVVLLASAETKKPELGMEEPGFAPGCRNHCKVAAGTVPVQRRVFGAVEVRPQLKLLVLLLLVKRF